MQNRSDTITTQISALRIAASRLVCAVLSISWALAACSGTAPPNGTLSVGGNGSHTVVGSLASGGSATGGASSLSTLDTVAGGATVTSSTFILGGSATVGGASSNSSSRRRCKRGVAYGHHSDADLTVLSPQVVWWYNWGYVPDSTLTANMDQQLSVEFVPMVWGPAVKLTDVEARLPAAATTLLGYNEPNFYAQANISAADTATKWPAIQAVADKKGLRLVSPAVNYCGGGCFDTDPFSYLKAFFQACPGCRVDVIAVHVYVGCQITSGNHAKWLIDHLQKYQTEFTQPIWLTEFACDDARNVAEQKAFLQDAVTYLEATPRIERYAWFAGRADNVPYVDLLGASGQLTELGQAYLAVPANANCQP
jgi:hypothetical protein